MQPDPHGDILIEGAREHNLRNVSARIPRGRLTVVTGPSGSGKSSLAFDTLFAEGQRRFVESLSAHARQFLDQLRRPAVDRHHARGGFGSFGRGQGRGLQRRLVALFRVVADRLRRRDHGVQYGLFAGL